MEPKLCVGVQLKQFSEGDPWIFDFILKEKNKTEHQADFINNPCNLKDSQQLGRNEWFILSPVAQVRDKQDTWKIKEDLLL